MSLPERAELFAPAKLTLSLRVTGIRADGMHLIDAEMVSLDFGDTVEVVPGDAVTYRGAWQGDGDGNDLVSKALALLGVARGVTVTKRIPAGAGLGGGSADAAAILRAGGFSDLVAAAELSADTSFCLVGGRARVTGIGEVVEVLAPRPQTFTLLTPPLSCSTPEVYRAWDALGGPVGEHGNDLEPAALVVEPEMARYRDRLSELAGSRARLAGSGSTWFVEGEFEGDDVVVTHTTDSLEGRR